MANWCQQGCLLKVGVLRLCRLVLLRDGVKCLRSFDLISHAVYLSQRFLPS